MNETLREILILIFKTFTNFLKLIAKLLKFIWQAFINEIDSRMRAKALQENNALLDGFSRYAITNTHDIVQRITMITGDRTLIKDYRQQNSVVRSQGSNGELYICFRLAIDVSDIEAVKKVTKQLKGLSIDFLKEGYFEENDKSVKGNGYYVKNLGSGLIDSGYFKIGFVLKNR